MVGHSEVERLVQSAALIGIIASFLPRHSRIDENPTREKQATTRGSRQHAKTVQSSLRTTTSVEEQKPQPTRGARLLQSKGARRNDEIYATAIFKGRSQVKTNSAGFQNILSLLVPGKSPTGRMPVRNR